MIYNLYYKLLMQIIIRLIFMQLLFLIELNLVILIIKFNKYSLLIYYQIINN